MMATGIPALAKRPASDGPACPVPMMMASNRFMWAPHRRTRSQGSIGPDVLWAVGSAVLVVGERTQTRTNTGELKRKLWSQLPTMPSLGEAFKPASDSGQLG